MPSESLVMFLEDNKTITSECVAAETRQDSLLQTVVECTKNGWGGNPPENLIPYFQRRHEISIEGDILLWGERVIVPQSLREIILKDLHAEHLGIVRSKQLARLYIWWPKLDSDIENMVKVCQRCQEHAKNPKADFRTFVFIGISL